MEQKQNGYPSSVDNTYMITEDFGSITYIVYAPGMGHAALILEFYNNGNKGETIAHYCPKVIGPAPSIAALAMDSVEQGFFSDSDKIYDGKILVDVDCGKGKRWDKNKREETDEPRTIANWLRDKAINSTFSKVIKDVPTSDITELNRKIFTDKKEHEDNKAVNENAKFNYDAFASGKLKDYSEIKNSNSKNERLNLNCVKWAILMLTTVPRLEKSDSSSYSYLFWLPKLINLFIKTTKLNFLRMTNDEYKERQNIGDSFVMIDQATLDSNNAISKKYLGELTEGWQILEKKVEHLSQSELKDPLRDATTKQLCKSAIVSLSYASEYLKNSDKKINILSNQLFITQKELKKITNEKEIAITKKTIEVYKQKISKLEGNREEQVNFLIQNNQEELTKYIKTQFKKQVEAQEIEEAIVSECKLAIKNQKARLNKLNYSNEKLKENNKMLINETNKLTNELKDQKSIFQKRIKQLEEKDKIQTNEINNHKGEAAKHKKEAVEKDNLITQELEEKNKHLLVVQKNLAELEQQNMEQIKENTLLKQSLNQQNKEHKKQIDDFDIFKKNTENLQKKNEEQNEQNLILQKDFEKISQENNKQQKKYSAQSKTIEELNKELTLKNLYIEEQNKKNTSFPIKPKQEKQNTDFISLEIEEIESNRKNSQDNFLLEEKLAIDEASVKKDFFIFAFMHHEKCYYQSYATYKSNFIEQMGDIDSDCSPEKRNRFNSIRNNQMSSGFKELDIRTNEILELKRNLEATINMKDSSLKLYSLAYISGQLNILKKSDMKSLNEFQKRLNNIKRTDLDYAENEEIQPNEDREIGNEIINNYPNFEKGEKKRLNEMKSNLLDSKKEYYQNLNVQKNINE